MSTRFWIEFDRNSQVAMFGLARFGVTAPDQAQALAMIRARVFHGRPLPPVKTLAADIAVASLDPDDVQDNMGDPDRPGIWFPLGF